MRPLGKLGLLAGLLALALAAAVLSPPAGASTSAFSPALEQAPDHSLCFERGRHCRTDAIAAPAQPQPIDLGAAASARFATPRVPLSVCARRVAPHAPRSLSILFRNFRE